MGDQETPWNGHTRLLTADEMRQIERRAIEAGRVSGRELMERAGRGVADAVAEAWPVPGRVAVLCGPGNNGGDGYVVARRLAERGWNVACWSWRPPEGLPPDAAAACRAWSALGEVRPWSEDAIRHWQPDVVVDAVFGAGLTRPPPDEIVSAFHAVAAPVVAIDAPTGLCMDSGRPLSEAAGSVAAVLTVTFHQPRLGHYLDQGPASCGRLVCIDIGLPEPGATGVPLVEAPVFALGKPTAGHKYTSGHALVLGGGPGRGGAARLAARGALRVGAGLVTIAVPPAALQEYAARLDAIMLRPLRDAEALAAMLEDRRLNALALGPGLGLGEGAAALVRAALEAERSTVLDADALTALSGRPDELMEALHGRCLLTPHDGEFARVFPDIAEELKAPPEGGPAMSRPDAVRRAAARAGCVVLLKGRDTVIAAPDGAAAISAAAYRRSAPWLATAGAGDVLTGMSAGLMARGASPFDAAATAAWLQIEAARSFGPGLISEDLPETIPAVLRRLD